MVSGASGARAQASGSRRLQGAHTLIVGAGGIGCELIKNLVLTGFANITIIDLDTIDLSNLNRQFLFRKHHCNQPKAIVAKHAAESFPHDPKLNITAIHDNVKNKLYNLDFFKKFHIVLNALDNVDARRHVNRMCLAANIPLVESGTSGYVGQVRAILKSKTKCFECDPITPPKSYPVCTIRNHPSKDVHCIAWAKELLFKRIFGGEETDLIDASEDVDDASAALVPLPGSEGAAATAPSANHAPPSPPPRGETICVTQNKKRNLSQMMADESPSAYAQRVFDTVFGADVHRLLAMETLWAERTPPVKLLLEKISIPSPEESTLAEENEQSVWSIGQCAHVFVRTIEKMLTLRGGDVGPLVFSKDDDDALDFVTAASNLRSHVFHIPLSSRWKVKEIAGNIIPAIATTNAIIAGFIVLEALKILDGKLDDVRYCSCNRTGAGRKRDALLSYSRIEPPSKSCYVCSDQNSQRLRVDCSRFTVAQLIEDVIKRHLSFNDPTIDYTTLSQDGEQLAEGIIDAEDMDEDDLRAHKRRESFLPQTLACLPFPIDSGTRIEVDDTSQELKINLIVENEDIDEEKYPGGFIVEAMTSGAASETKRARS